MKTLKHLHSFIILLLLSGFAGYTQERIDVSNEELRGTLPNIGRAKTTTRNINHPDAVNFQEEKKSVCFLRFRSPIPKDNDGNFIPNGTRKLKRGTGFLVNTVANTQKVYLLTAHHLAIPVGKWLDYTYPDAQGNPIQYSEGMTEDEKKDIFISCDYEVANPNKKESQQIELNEKNAIRRFWRVKLNPLVQDEDSDIALYEIVSDPTESKYQWTIENSEIFQHVYLSGWSLHPRDARYRINDDDKITQIGHPKGDQKKVMSQDLNKSMHRRTSRIEPYHPITETDVKFDRVVLSSPYEDYYTPEKGSSGSPVFNPSKRVISILKSGDIVEKESYSTFLHNSWRLPNFRDREITTSGGFRLKDLQSYLDPQETWLSSIPGGYLKDLMPNPLTANFNLTLTNNGFKESTVHLTVANFYAFYIDGSNTEGVLGSGIKLAEGTTLEPNQEVSLSLRASDGTELYKRIYNNNMPNSEKVFKSRKGGARSLRQRILAHQGYKDEDVSLEYLSKIKLEDAKIKLEINEGSTKVRAIKLPRQMPYNAKELFKTNPYPNLWRSYKYKPLKGKNSEGLYIKRISFDVKEYIYDKEKDKCVKKTNDYIQIANIESGNNGGYLNLINPNYAIALTATHPKCKEKGKSNKFKVTLEISTIGAHFYGGIDYWKERKESDLTYNYVNDPSGSHPQEKLFSKEINASKYITSDKNIPTSAELGFAENQEKIVTQALFAIVKNLNDSEQEITPGSKGKGEYEQGEAERYLISIKKEDTKEKEETAEETEIAFKPSKEVKEGGAGLGDRTETPDQTNNPPTDNAQEGVGDGNNNNIISLVGDYGKVFYNFPGEVLVLLNKNPQTEEEKVLYNSTPKRVVSLNILLKEAVEENQYQVLFDEGNDQNGFALRLKGTPQGAIVEMATTINGNKQTLVANNTPLSIKRFVNLIAAFENGTMSLLINGEKQGTNTVFKDNDQTQIPDRADTQAALGGIAGKDAFGSNANTSAQTYKGLLEEMLVFGETSFSVDYIAWVANQDPTAQDILERSVIKHVNNVGDLQEADKNFDEADQEILETLGQGELPSRKHGAKIQGIIPNPSNDPNPTPLKEVSVNEMGFDDQGLDPQTNSLVSIPVVEIMSFSYQSMFSNGGGGPGDDPGDDPDFPSGFNFPNPDTPEPNQEAAEFDPDNPDDWKHLGKFKYLYNNLNRILYYTTRFGSDRPDIFIVFEDDQDYEIFNRFAQLYNTKEKIDALFLGKTSDYQKLLALYNISDTIIKPALEEIGLGEFYGLYKELFAYILQFETFKQALVTYENEIETAVNLTRAGVKWGVDWLGQVIPKPSDIRAVLANVSLLEYPNQEELAVIYQALGTNNSTTIAVNSTGHPFLITELDNQTITLTGDAVVPLNENVLFTTIFDKGALKLFINDTEVASGTINTTADLSYNGFTKQGNGAFFGSPASNYTEHLNLEGKKLNASKIVRKQFYMINDPIVEQLNEEVLGEILLEIQNANAVPQRRNRAKANNTIAPPSPYQNLSLCYTPTLPKTN